MKAEQFEVKEGTLIIHLETDLDHHSAVYIRENADRLIEEHSINRVVFDFNGVEFMDSSGIGVIMGRYKLMSYVGGAVYVYGIGRNVDRIFQMSGLYKLVKQWKQEEANRV